MLLEINVAHMEARKLLNADRSGIALMLLADDRATPDDFKRRTSHSGEIDLGHLASCGNIQGRGDFGYRENSNPSMTDTPTWISLKG
jgi:hypothetical protein